MLLFAGCMLRVKRKTICDGKSKKSFNGLRGERLKVKILISERMDEVECSEI
jgi:hypothetical protein